ncbi:MAG TPA: hypothetical protein VGS20_12175 [Candidatus Acidoferrales bacterium]|nr:hypothetical protein [Candidatus Acidoferrales bacterium]
MGPPGGDVRSLAADPATPAVAYLGTSDGHVFVTQDGGRHWALDGRVGRRLDSVVASIVVDGANPRLLYAGAWTLDPQAGGGVYRSRDSGRTWQSLGLAGMAVRALAQAPSDPRILVAGTLVGAFRSADAGATWQRISPASSDEIHNLDSVAIDPRNPAIIYVGTYHLPWKTTDGGAHWFPIHAGMIDDSDVFSISIDRSRPERVFLSACSGIYRSDNGGLRWLKVQGIPSSARRTLAIQQDPLQRETVYAGTTEGLWKTTDAGSNWRRVTPDNWIINALLVDPRRQGRLIVGTERLGILLSNDGGRNYQVSNDGFNHRQIAAVALDAAHPSRVLAILSDAPDPVVATDDGGATWRPLGEGLRWQAVRRIYASPAGWWAALDKGGLVRYDAARAAWVAAGQLVGEAAWTFEKGRLIKPEKRPFDLVVDDMAFGPRTWFAATAYGLLGSDDSGATWREIRFAPLILPVHSVAVTPQGAGLWVVADHGLVFSPDAGRTWTWHNLPMGAGPTIRLAVADARTLLAITAKGLYISRDDGATWTQAAHGMPEVPVRDVAAAGATLLASVGVGGLYVSHDRGRTWAPVEGSLAESYFPVVAARAGSSLVYAASASDGLYAVNLEASASAEAASASRGSARPY